MAYEKDSKFEAVNRLKQKNKQSRQQKRTARKSGFGEPKPLEYHGGPMKTEKIDEKELNLKIFK